MENYSGIMVRNPYKTAHIEAYKPKEMTWAEKQVYKLRYKRFIAKQRMARLYMTLITIFGIIPAMFGAVTLLAYTVPVDLGFFGGIAIGLAGYIAFSLIRDKWFSILDSMYYGW